MQDRLSSYSNQDSCFQKPAMRRALGELTNSPRTNSPRRALGELTNSPRLLDQQRSPRFLSPIHATPTKEQAGPLAKKSPAITPTHNLKLLTELAAKVAGGNTSSARQTLQFEDIDTSRYRTEPVCLGGVTSRTSSTTLRTQSTALRTPSTISNAAGNIDSPHKDHNYPNKVIAAEYEPKDEVCSEYIKLEPTVTAEEARIETGLKPLNFPQAGKVSASAASALDKNNIRPPLPPLLPESALFVPPIDRGNRKDKSLGLLAERMLQNYPYAMGHGDCAEVQLDDTAKLLHTERRRIYDIVNVFEAVQMMSRVCKNVYRWHGRTYLVQSLAWLRQLGIKLGMQEQYRIAREQEIHDIENLSPLTSPRVASPAMQSPMMSPMMSPYGHGSPGMSPYGSPNDPCGTSMGINTQKFLMLFLVIPEQKKLTLDFAAKVIHGPNPSEKAKVTRVRRLYDIANILQALGLIRKVQIAEGKAKKPAFEYVGPDVEHMHLTDEEKKRMPSARQKNSLLAVGKNLAQLPDKDESGAAGGSSAYALVATAAAGTGAAFPGGSSCTKRARSLSDEHRFIPSGKLVRTHSENGRSPTLSVSSLLELGEVCQREREMLDDNKGGQSVLQQDQENMFSGGFSVAGGSRQGQENNENDHSFHMNPPTPGLAPSRKKVLLQRYYSDSQLQLNSKPTPQPKTSPHNFISPSPVTPSYGQSLLRSPRSFAASSRPVPFPSPLALKSSPMTPKNTSHYPYSSSSQKPQSPRQHTSLRSPITPRDMRNSAILPPSSPVNNSRVPCSPMGPVGRSLLASPASPKSPMDLSLRTSAASFRYHGKSPLASRSLNLPPSPVTSNDSASQSPKPLQLLSRQSSNENLSTSPLLRAYLANNKSSNSGSSGTNIFRPLPDKSNNITVIGLLSDSTTCTTPPQTPSSKDRIQLADAELEGIYRLPNTSVSAAVAANHQQHSLPAPQSKPESLIKLPSIDTPMDFSRLLANCQPRMGGLPRPADGLPRPRAVLGSSLMSPNFASSQDRY